MKKLLMCLAAVCAAMAGHADDYTVLDYVEATGTQWVDTGIVGRYDTKAEIEAEWTSLEGDMALLASRGNDGTVANATRINFANGFNYGQGLLVGYGYGLYVRPHVWWIEGEGTENEKTYDSERAWELNRIYAISTEFAKTGESETTIRMTVDGVKMMEDQVNKTDCAVTNALVDTGCNLAIFANNISGQITGGAKARIYGLKIWQDGELKRDFVPVLKDGRAGFRDSVTGGFFFSNSSTELVAGPDASTPDGYVGYIESTGNTYIDLDVVGRSGLTMESRMCWIEVPGDGSYVASRRGNNPRFYMYHHYQKNTIGYDAYYNSGAVAQPGVVYDVRSVLTNGVQKLTIDGVDQISRADSASVDTGLNLYLFACNKDGEAVYKTKARCYGLKIWDGDTLVRDLVPCVKRRKAALLDRVSGRFFFAGTGTLAMGRDATQGRPDYFVEYLESKGDTWLDTGVRARPNVQAVCEFALTQRRSVQQERYLYFGDAYSHAERTVLGACDAYGSKRFYPIHMPNGDLWMGYNETRVYPPRPSTGESRCVLGTARHRVDTTLAQGNQTVVLDDETVYQGTDGSLFDAGCNLYLFACNKGGTASYMSNSRVYSLKLWQDGVLMRDFRPCVKDGEGGLYDAQNHVVYLPLGRPIVGSNLGPTLGDDPLVAESRLAYVESDGSTWVDTGIVGRSGTKAELTFMPLWRTDCNGTLQSEDMCLLGSRTDLYGDANRFFLCHATQGSLAYGYGGFIRASAVLATGEVHTVVADLGVGGQTVTLGGDILRQDADTRTINTTLPLYLLAANVGGEAKYPARARLYRAKIWQDGVLVRNYMPMQTTNGEVGLWDRVSRTFAPLSSPFCAVGEVTGPAQVGSVIIVR